MTDKDDDFLDQFFDDARADDVTPSDDLRARVLADAVAEQAVVSEPEPRAFFFPNLIAMCGGWPALGGVLAAGVAGLWVGLVPPAAVETFAADMLGTTTEISFFTDIDDLMEGDFNDG